MAPKKEDRQPIVLDQEIESFPPEESQRFDQTTAVEESGDQNELPTNPAIVDRYVCLGMFNLELAAAFIQILILFDFAFFQATHIPVLCVSVWVWIIVLPFIRLHSQITNRWSTRGWV